MKVEIITIRDEILIGQIVDTNSAWLGQKLNLNGLWINRITSVGDAANDIISALESAEKNADIIIITGGLGPTKDDITKNMLCKYFHSNLIFNEGVYKQVEHFITGRGGIMNELNRSQAMVPDNCTPLQNANGTAPGLWFEKQGKIIVSLPGVPYEMKGLIENHVLPKIKEKFKLPGICHRTLSTIDISEAKLAELLERYEERLPSNLKLAYLPSPGIVRLRLTGNGEDMDGIKLLVNHYFSELTNLIPAYIYGYESETIQEVIGNLLKTKKQTLSTAESCTGGNISHLITLISGSSDYFKGSIIAYSNEIKAKLLGVLDEDILQHGVVSEPVVKQMALGVNRLLVSDYSIAVSGIAGPTGGSTEKPIGTVWIAIAYNERVISKRFMLGENRERNIEKASLLALNMLRLELVKNE